MLTRSKRNTAYAYLGKLIIDCPVIMLPTTGFCVGMSIRFAYALGLHREETQVVFTGAEQALRRKLWQSLFVLDRFLSSSLGRLTAILEENCLGYALKLLDPSFVFNHSNMIASGLEASARSCHDVGIILQKVYQRRKISTKLALSSARHWRQVSSSKPRDAINILHVNLLYCHSVILLTRRFFVYLLNAEILPVQRHPSSGSKRPESKMEKFSNVCIIASLHTVALTHNAYEGKYLPRCNLLVN